MSWHCHCYGLNVICAGFQCESVQEKAAFHSEYIQSDKGDAYTQRQRNGWTHAIINVKQFTLMFYTSVLIPLKSGNDDTIASQSIPMFTTDALCLLSCDVFWLWVYDY